MPTTRGRERGGVTMRSMNGGGGICYGEDGYQSRARLLRTVGAGVRAGVSGQRGHRLHRTPRTRTRRSPLCWRDADEEKGVG
eukprot:9498001-Pyramimonas_sp.AAC.2